MDHLSHAKLVGGEAPIRDAGKNRGEAAEAATDVEYGVRSQDMSPVRDVILVRALREQIAFLSRRREAVGVAELGAVLICDEGIEAIIGSKVVIPAAHRLVVMITAGI